MKLRVKIHDHPNLRMVMDLPDADKDTGAKHTLTLINVRECLQHEVLLRVGYRLISYDLSLNGTYTLADSLANTSLDDLGLVSGDLLHVLNSRWAEPEETEGGEPVVLAQGQQLEPIRVSDLPEAHAPPTQPAVMADTVSAHVPSLLVWHVERRCWRLLEQSGSQSRGGFRQWIYTLAALDAEQLIFMAIHVLMLEAGLAPIPDHENEGKEEKDKDDSSSCESRWQLPESCWHEQLKRDGLLQAKYKLCDERLPVEDTVTVSAVGVGGVLAVHATLEQDRALFTAPLRVADYVKRLSPAVLASASGCGKNPQELVKTARGLIASRFTRLRQLSNIFRSALIVPLLVRMRAQRGQVSPYEWRALPYEIQLAIMRLMSVRDLLKLAATGRQQRSRASEPTLWRWLVLRDFPRHRDALSAELTPHADWRARYIELYKQRSQRVPGERPYLLPRIGTLPFILPEGLAWPEFSAGEVDDGWGRLTRPVNPLDRVLNGGKYDRIPGLEGLDWSESSVGIPPLALPLNGGRGRRTTQQPRLNQFI